MWCTSRIHTNNNPSAQEKQLTSHRDYIPWDAIEKDHLFRLKQGIGQKNKERKNRSGDNPLNTNHRGERGNPQPIMDREDRRINDEKQRRAGQRFMHPPRINKCTYAFPSWRKPWLEQARPWPLVATSSPRKARA